MDRHWRASQGEVCSIVHGALLRELRNTSSLRAEHTVDSWVMADRKANVFVNDGQGGHKQRITVMVSQASPLNCLHSVLLGGGRLLHGGELKRLPCIADGVMHSVALHEVSTCETGDVNVLLESRWCMPAWAGPMFMPPKEQVLRFGVRLVCNDAFIIGNTSDACNHADPYGIFHETSQATRRQSHSTWAAGSWRLLDDGRYLLTASQLNGMTRAGEPQVEWLDDDTLINQPLRIRPISVTLDWNTNAVLGYMIQIRWTNGVTTQSAVATPVPSNRIGGDDASEGAFEWRPTLLPSHCPNHAPHLAGVDHIRKHGTPVRKILMAGMSRTRVIMYEMIRLLDTLGGCSNCTKTLDSTIKQVRVNGGARMTLHFYPLEAPQITSLVSTREAGIDIEQQAALMSSAGAWTELLIRDLRKYIQGKGFCAGGNVVFLSFGSHEVPVRLAIDMAPMIFAKLFASLRTMCRTESLPVFAYVTELPWQQPFDVPARYFDRGRLETYDPDRISAINAAAMAQAVEHKVPFVDLHALFRARVDALVDGAHPYARWKGMWDNEPAGGRRGNAVATLGADALIDAAIQLVLYASKPSLRK